MKYHVISNIQKTDKGSALKIYMKDKGSSESTCESINQFINKLAISKEIFNAMTFSATV